MIKLKLKDLKYLKSCDNVINLNKLSLDEVSESLDKVGYSMGVNGVNGYMYIGYKSGKIYIITYA